jgi:hypothetical protein
MRAHHTANALFKARAAAHAPHPRHRFSIKTR